MSDENNALQDYTNSEVEQRHNVQESADKIQVKTAIKRGSGTRDQDKIKVRVKGDDAEEVVQKLNSTVARLRKTADELRDTQPKVTEDDDD